jgi:hypothetical protein
MKAVILLGVTAFLLLGGYSLYFPSCFSWVMNLDHA